MLPSGGMISLYTYSCCCNYDQDEIVLRVVFAEADSDEEHISDNEYEVDYVRIFLYKLNLRIFSCAVFKKSAHKSAFFPNLAYVHMAHDPTQVKISFSSNGLKYNIMKCTSISLGSVLYCLSVDSIYWQKMVKKFGL